MLPCLKIDDFNFAGQRRKGVFAIFQDLDLICGLDTHLNNKSRDQIGPKFGLDISRDGVWRKRSPARIFDPFRKFD